MIYANENWINILSATQDNPELNNLRVLSRKSYNYYLSVQHDYMDEYFKNCFENWTVSIDGVSPQSSIPIKMLPITRKIIKSLSMLYKKAPVRTLVDKTGKIDEDGTALYNQLIVDKNMVMREVDAYTRLMKTVLVRVFWQDGLKYRIMPPHSCDVIENAINPQKLEAVLYQYLIPPTEFTDDLYDYENSYIFWDKENTYIVNEDGEILRQPLYDKDGNILLDSKSNPMENPYGVIPFATFRDSFYCGSSFWQPIDETFININESINEILTDLAHAERVQAFSQAVLKGMMTGSLNTSRMNILRINADSNEDFFYRSPESHIEEIIEVLRFWSDVAFYLNDLGYQTLKAESDLRSGIAIIANRLDMLEDRDSRKELFAPCERELFQLERAVYNYHAGIDNLPKIREDVNLRIDWAEVNYPLGYDERAGWEQHLIATNQETSATLLMKENPDISDITEAENIILANRDFNQKSQGTPVI